MHAELLWSISYLESKVGRWATVIAGIRGSGQVQVDRTQKTSSRSEKKMRYGRVHYHMENPDLLIIWRGRELHTDGRKVETTVHCQSGCWKCA